MAYTLRPLDPDDQLLDAAPADAPAAEPAAPAPEIGPKNVYRKGQPQVSQTDTVTIPNAEQYVLPKVVDENAQPAEAAPKYTLKPLDPDDQLVNPSEVYDPKSDTAITRGLKTSWTGMEQSIGMAGNMARWATMDPEEVRKEMLEHAGKPADPRNARLVTPSLGDIGTDPSKFLTWFGEATGTTLGSWIAAAVYGGGAGAAAGGAGGAIAGSVVPGLGTAAGALAGAGGGFTYGTGAAFLASGPGGLMDDLLADKGVQDGLKDNSINPTALNGLSAVGGLAIGALDAFPATKMIGKLGGKEITKDLIKTTLKRAVINGAKHGAIEEGGTEGLQGTISEFAQALMGGNWDVAQRALSVLDQAAVGAVGGGGPGAVGGAVENARIPTPGQDQADAEEAAPATEPGVQTAPDTAGTNTPGDVDAAKPQPAAGSTATAAATPAATTDVDPAVAAAAAAAQPGKKPGEAGAGPAATPTDQPVVEEGEPTPEPYPEDTTPVIPDDATPDQASVIEQQQEELARVSREQYAAKQAEDAAKAQEQAAQTPVVSTKAEDIAAAITATQAKRKPIPTATTQAVDTGGNAAPIATAPLPGTPTTATQTTPVVPVTATTPLAAEQAAQPLDTATATAQGTAGIPGEIAQAAGTPSGVTDSNRAAVELHVRVLANRGMTDKAISESLRGKIDVNQVRAVRESLGIEAAGAPAPVASVAAEPVAALQSAAKPAVTLRPIAADDTLLPPKAELIKGVSKTRGTGLAGAKASMAKAGAVAGEYLEGHARGQEQAAADRARAEEALGRMKESVAALSPAPTAAPAAPLTKAEQVKRRLAGRKTVEIAKKPAERVEPAAAPEARPEAPTQPAPAPAAAAAKKTAAARHVADSTAQAIHDQAQTQLERVPGLSRDMVKRAVEEVAREAANAETADMRGRSLSEVARDALADREALLAKVHERLKPAIDEAEAESERISRTAAETAAEKEAVKRKEQAAAKQGTKKERVSSRKGLSSEGIMAQSEESILRQEEKELKKLPKKRDQAVMRQAQLVREVRRKETSAERKAEIVSEMQLLKESRAEAQREKEEAAAAGHKELSPEHQAVEEKLDEATSKLPQPQLTGPEDEQVSTLKQHLADFLKAIDGIKVAGRHDRKANSPLENLAVFAHKLRKGGRDAEGQGPLEFWLAHGYVEDGSPTALEQLTALATNENIKGARLEEEVTGEEADVTERLEEGDVAERVHRQTSEDLALRGRGGRQAAVSRAQSEAKRASRSRFGVGTIEALDKDGNVIEIEADTATAAARLRDIDPSELPDRGFFSLFRNAHIRRLMQLVGNVPVHIISSEDMRRLRGNALGLYRGYSNADRARGIQPEVFITEEAANNMGSMAYGHVLVHELTHAATAMAYRENIRGTRKLIDRMRVALIKELRRQGHDEYSLNELGVDYGLFQDTSELAGLEFIAEAFSNPEFQAMLATYNAPRSIQADVAAITGGRLLSWWNMFTAAVSNAIGMTGGRRGQTYMDTVLALHPHLMQSSVWQDARARENNFAKMMEDMAGDGGYQLPRAVPSGPADTLMLTAELKQRLEGVKERASTGWVGTNARKLAYKVMTTGELKRRATELFGSVDNAFNKLADVLLRKEPLRAKFRAIGNRIESELMKFEHSNRETYRKLSEFLHEASRLGIDPMVPLNHVNNKHVPKTGARGAGRRAGHAEMAKEWSQFPPEAQKLARDAAQHYRQMHDLESAAHIKYAVQAAMKKYRATEKLPAGKTMDDVVEWVRSGAAARKEDERTAEDKAFHAALGETARTLADIPELRRLNGLYFPLARRGKWFITAIEKLATPVGAVADPSSPDGNRFLFYDEKKLNDFVENSDYIVNVSSRWLDPLTFKRTIKSDDKVDPATGQLVHPVQQFVATVQNRRLEMHDSRAALARRQKELQAEGHEVSAIGLTEHDLHDQVGQIAPSQIAALLRNTEQTTIGQTTLGQQAVKDALLDSYIRSMTTQSALTHRLKRKGTLGYSLDLTSAMREYNRSTASHLANLELAPEMAEHQAALQKDINARRRSEPGTRIEQLQQLQKELSDRIKATGAVNEKSGLSRWADALMNVSYMRHLFSPHYTIINMLQPFMTTYPMLAAKYGDGAAWREIIRAYRIGGVRKTLGQGFSETWQATRNLNPMSPARVTEAELEGTSVHGKMWREMVAGEDDAANLHDVMDTVDALGFGASSGIEAGNAAEAELTTVEKTLSRLTNVAKGLPEAAEGINRYTTAIAAYRLARRAGLSHEAARAEAVSMVEQTQGGYARANNPIFMQNPLLRLPMQFKKYGLMYGQMFYGNVARLVAPSSDPAQRKMAAKALARLSATTMVFAGAGGLPFVELARILANAAMGLGLRDDDWDDDENALQQWFAGFVGNPLSEAATHGLTRLAGIDTSNTLGADNLVTFGQPRNMDEDGTMAWLFKSLVLGAGGSMAWDSAKALHDGDIAGAVPWPKVIKNLTDAIGLYTEGTVSKTSGEQYAAPVNIGEAITKGLGFQPASSARQWETTGGGRASKEEGQLKHQRYQLFDKWNRARTRSGPAAAAQVFADDVRAWNKAHPEKKFRIDMGDLMRSKREHEKATRERERAAAAQ